MAEKIIFAMYDDDDKLMNGAKHLVNKGVRISDVYSPMPLHGIDSIIGVEPTRACNYCIPIWINWYYVSNHRY